MPVKHWQEAWGIKHLSRKPVPGFDHPLSKERSSLLLSKLDKPHVLSRHAFQPLHQLCCPPLEVFKYRNIFFKLWGTIYRIAFPYCVSPQYGNAISTATAKCFRMCYVSIAQPFAEKKIWSQNALAIGSFSSITQNIGFSSWSPCPLKSLLHKDCLFPKSPLERGPSWQEN